MITRWVRPVLALVSCLLASACVTLPPIEPNAASPIRSVAILPFINNTNDVDGPAVMREIFTAEMGRYYYVIKPLAETDQILKDQMGITLGSQLDMAKPQQLGEKLGVDGVIYGSLEDFSHKITGVYNVKRVRVRVKMVNCKTGETVWSNGIGVKQALAGGGGGLLGNVPVLGTALSVAAAASSIGSKLSDRDDKDLPKLLGDDIEAPWHELPEQAADFASSAAISVADRAVSKALSSPLRHEAEVAAGILLHGYYHDGGWFSKPINYGTMIPRGPSGPAPAK